MQASPHSKGQPRSPFPSPLEISALDLDSAHSWYLGGGSPACQSRQGACSPPPLQHLYMTKEKSYIRNLTIIMNTKWL